MFGVIVPALITVAVFIGFLLCWFKLGLSNHFIKQHSNGTTRGQQSACSSDSLCDVTGSTSCGSDVHHSVCTHKVSIIDDVSCVNDRDKTTTDVCSVNVICTNEGGSCPLGASASDCSCSQTADVSYCSSNDNYGHVVPSAPTPSR